MSGDVPAAQTHTAPRFVLASRNAKKLAELQRILAAAAPGFDPGSVVSAASLELPEVLEDAVTFEGNAAKKARSAAEATGLIAIADDSGLAVDVLGGSPGIFSARWSGRHGDDAANNALLLAQLADVPEEHRTARFVCAVAAVLPDSRQLLVRGEMPGRILREQRGAGGFGYDPLFLPDGEELTSAELPPERKDAISHRGRALVGLADRLRQEGLLGPHSPHARC